MRLLLDTHALIWWTHEPEKLTDRVVDVVGDPDNEIFVSAVSAMELATKFRRNRLDYFTPLATHFVAESRELGFLLLDITPEHAQLAGSLQGSNKDPWDRLLAAQAQVAKLLLISCDSRMAELDIDPYW